LTRACSASFTRTRRWFAEENGIDLVTSGLQGYQGRFDLEEDGAGGLKVTDTKTGEVHEAERRGKHGNWRITLVGTDGKKRHRYFSEKAVESAKLRKRLGAIPKKELDRRNNVESAMFQVSFHTRNNKTRYCGLEKHRMWAMARYLRMNFVRLKNHKASTCQGTPGDKSGGKRSFCGLIGGAIGKIRELLFAVLQEKRGDDTPAIQERGLFPGLLAGR